MKVTQQVIEVAMAMLPASPPPGQLTIKSRVFSYDVGIGSRTDTNAAYVDVRFEWKSERKKWLCRAPLDEQEPGCIVPYCVRHNVEYKKYPNGTACPECLADPNVRTSIMYGEKPALNVVELKPRTKEPGDNVVQRLEQALELARKGELSNVVVVAVLNNGDVMDCWANGSQPYAVVGGLEGLKFEFINACIEKREEQ